MRELAQPVGGAKSGAHSEVIDRQNVGAAEVEHEQHLHRPAADPADLGEALDDRRVVEPLERRAPGNDRGERLGGEILEGGDLGEREAGGAQLLDRGGEHLLRRRKGAPAARGDETREDGVGGGAVQLLVRDGLRQYLERLAVRLGGVPIGAGGADDAAQHRIHLTEVPQNVPAHASSPPVISDTPGNSTSSADPA